MVYDRVLVVSDNVFLYNKFKKIITDLNLPIEIFQFAISPFSKKENFDDDILVFDMKNYANINFISSNYNLVFSLHCKQIFPSELINKIKCINIHPGYNPINRGWYPQVFSIIKDLPIGVTIHEIDEKLDNGYIIVREEIEKYSYDTSDSLYDRLLEKEIELIYEYLPSILNGNYNTFKPEDSGNLFLKKEYNNLLEIELDENCRTGDFIDKLRALTHRGYKNAFFIDKKTEKKIYISIKLELDE
jgi:methionyl-tRNA formyltransferase